MIICAVEIDLFKFQFLILPKNDWKRFKVNEKINHSS